MMAHVFNPNTQEAEAGESLWGWDQAGLRNESLTQKGASYIFLYSEGSWLYYLGPHYVFWFLELHSPLHKIILGRLSINTNDHV